jgi:hypothetical protein
MCCSCWYGESDKERAEKTKWQEFFGYFKSFCEDFKVTSNPWENELN